MLSRWKDLRVGIILLVLCGLIFAASAQFEDVPVAFAQGMQADAFPRLIAVTIGVLAVILIWQGRETPEPERPKVRLRVFATALVLLVAAAMMVPAGVTLTAVATCFVIPVLWGERNFAKVGVFALAIPILLYLVFSVALKLRLPQGPLQGIL